MIREQAISVGFDLAQSMSEKGFVLAPKAGTPVKVLFDYSTKGNGVPYSGAPVENCIGQQLKDNANGDGVVQTAHTVAAQEAVETVYRACANAIAFARNTVNPVVKAVHEAVAAASNDTGWGSIRYAVAPFYYDELFELPAWVAMMEKHAEVPVGPLRIDVRAFPEVDGQYLLEALKVGSSKIDDRFTEILAGLPDQTLMNVYNSVFRGIADANVDLQLFLRTGGGDLTFSPNRLNIHYVALAYALAVGMFKKAPEGVKLTEADYENQVSSVIAQAGRRICRGMEARKEDLRTGLLVIRFPHGQPFANDASDTGIIVNGDVYDKFLASNGTPEILIGNAQETRDSFLPEIVQGSEHSLRVYRKFEAQLVEQHDATFVSRVKSALLQQIMEVVKATPDDELSRQRTDCVAELREHLRLVQRAELDNLWCLVRRLVCHVLYPHSDALKILSTFDEIAGRLQEGKQEPVSPETIEYHVLLSYTLDYLVECVDVRDLK